MWLHSRHHRPSRHPCALFLSSALLAFCVLHPARAARTVTLAWDPVTSSVIAGYRVHYGLSSGVYTASVDVADATTATIDTLAEDTNYYFVVTAYNEAGDESTPSNEVDLQSSGAAAETFQAWQEALPGTGNSAASNQDSDLWDDLCEYALGSDPESGEPVFIPDKTREAGLQFERLTNNAVEASYLRSTAPTDLNYVLQVSHDLTAWTDTSVVPAVAAVSSGAERLTYTGLGSDSNPNVTPVQGFARLRITHIPSQETRYTGTFGWCELTIKTGFQTVGPTMLKKPVFAGKAASYNAGWLTVDQASLAVGTSLGGLVQNGQHYFLEFSGGPYTGHRLEISEALTTATQIAIDLSQAAPHSIDPAALNLGGDAFILRAHHLLSELFDLSVFKGSGESASADQVLFFTNGAFEKLFYLDIGPGYQFWSDSNFANKNDRAVRPGEGIFVKAVDHVTPAQVFEIGQVRTHDFAQPLQQGFQMVSGGWPVEQSPNGVNGRGMRFNDFAGSGESSLADQILTWLGDAPSGMPAADGFKVLFMLDLGPGFQYWSDISFNNNDEIPVFKRCRAAFLNIRNPVADHSLPLPWNPNAP